MTRNPFRCSQDNQNLLKFNTADLKSIVIENKFVCKVNEDKSRCNVATTLANGFLATTDLRESASVLPDIPGTMTL